MIEVDLAEKADSEVSWCYTLGFKSEGTGAQRVRVSKERVVDIYGKVLIDRPDKQDNLDKERLTQTFLEQINANHEFREIADFFASITYLHLVPQLLKYSEQLGNYRLENDPFGQSFLERIAKSPQKTRDARLRKIEEALRACVPNMTQLKFMRDGETGKPHLEAILEAFYCRK